MTQLTDPDIVPSNPEEAQPLPANISREDHEIHTALALKDSLGAALTKQGKYSEAATLLREVLATRESLNQSSTSPGMLCTMNNLAAALHHQGDLTSAESLHRQVLHADLQTLGISHPSTLISMHNLASVLAEQGSASAKDNSKLSEAAGMLQQALEVSEQTNGLYNRQTLSIMGKQVDILLRQDKCEQAEPLAREVLALARETLRPQHPEIATAMHNLGAVLRKLGKVEEADTLQQEQRALGEVAGEENPGADDGDGQVAMQEGRYKDAENIFRKGLVTGAA